MFRVEEALEVRVFALVSAGAASGYGTFYSGLLPEVTVYEGSTSVSATGQLDSLTVTPTT